MLNYFYPSPKIIKAKCALCVLLLLLTVGAHGDLELSGKLAAAAREQIGITVFYDPSYRALSYPGGDLPMDRGVCTDVIIRAARTAWNMDFQQQVHEDMRHHFDKYPRNWGLNRPDKSIDHRRVPNLQTFFRRRGWDLPISDAPSDYLPGDLVTCVVPPNLPHIMIVSDRKNSRGVPLVIHNIGTGAQEEDRLFEFELTGHYRIKGVVN